VYVQEYIEIIKQLHTKKLKEPGETVEETSGCAAPERVNKWHISMTVS
jgi:hypothetical protein